MNPTTIINTDNNKGAFEVKIDKETEAKMTFVFAGTDKIIIEHTEVNPDYKGKGFGKLLIEKVIELAKEKKMTIIPLCPFAKKYLERHPEFNDLL
jgi:uncharacterized protein